MSLPFSINAEWVHLAFVFDGDNLDANGKCAVKVYFNGAYLNSQSPTAPPTDNGQVLRFMGDAAYTGAIDEFRLQDGAASADWVRAEYESIVKPDFYSADFVLDAMAVGHFLVTGSDGITNFPVSPSFGAHPASNGQAFTFSAPNSEHRLDDGRYLSYSGYRLFSIDAAGNVTLVADSDALSGSFTYTASGAQLVWKESFRRGGPTFATTHSSIVTVTGYTGVERQRHFPVLFRLAENSPEGFSYADVQQGGADILFTTQAGDVLPHEIEMWDTNGTSAIWVNLPEMALGTKFLFRYGNATVTSPRSVATDVWADAGYAGVWHMAETNAADSAADSTGHGLHAVPGGAAAAQMIGDASGAAGGARVIASSAVVNSFTVPNYDFLGLGCSFTIGGWFKASAITSNGRVFCRKATYTDANGWEVQWNNNTASAPQTTPRGSSGSTGATALGVSLTSGWAYLAWVFDGVKAWTYVNGALVGQNNIFEATDNRRSMTFLGSYAYRGSLDEVRLYPGAAPASRLLANYQTVAVPDFLSATPVAVSAGADFLSVESFGEERGEPVPAYGTHTGLTDGQVVAFSAPVGEQIVDEDLHYRFSGWSLTVTDPDGNEGLPQNSTTLSGTYTHASGASARLVWNVEDLHAVRTTSAGGSIMGAGYYPMGAAVTLSATPPSGYRVWDWKVNGEVTGHISNAITIIVSGVMEVEAVFSPIPTTLGLWTLSSREEGEELSTLANEIANTLTGVSTAVSTTAGAGALPTCADERPSVVVYSDASATSVLSRAPKAIRFAPAAGFSSSQGGAEIVFEGLASFIAATNDVTIECFAKSDTTAQYRGLLSANLGNDPHCLFFPGSLFSYASFNCETANSGNKGSVSRALRGRTTEAWHHVALIYKPAEQKARFFVDYVEASSAKAVSILGEGAWAGHSLRLGSCRSNSRSDLNYAGLVSCLRVSYGERDVSEFMVAAPYDPSSDDETVALFNPRGPTGEPATTFRNLVGDRRLPAVCVNPAGEITWTNDAPGEAVFASAADLAARKVLLRRPGSLHFADTDSASSYVVLENLSQILSNLGDFTVEFFARNEGTNIWKTAFTLNFTGYASDNAQTTKVQIPGTNLSLITLEYPSKIEYNVGYDMTGGGNWHHIALVHTKVRDRLDFYVDYVRRGSIEVFAKENSTGPALLGAHYAHGEFFEGEISALRVTRRVLAADEFLVAGPNPVQPLKIFVQ